ncbi:hypothetical protein E2320_017087 [Naja naja]|nr:hypothetical protein E2320_017087 [Naja naja]
MNTYIFSYYLIQFCGHSWIFTNMFIRFLSFGEDSVADTFHSIGLVMRICQLASILELLHIWFGIEKDQFFPRFLQITERIVILFVAIASQEEVQGKGIVCVLFFLWSCIDVIRSEDMDVRSLIKNIQPLAVDPFAIYESLPHFETSGTYSIRIFFPFELTIYFPYVLKMYMAILFAGAYFIVQYLYTERKTYLGSDNIKEKRS